MLGTLLVAIVMGQQLGGKPLDQVNPDIAARNRAIEGDVKAERVAKSQSSLSPTRQRQILQAYRDSQNWARLHAEHLFPYRVWASMPNGLRRKHDFWVRGERAKVYLKAAALRQVCVAYEVNEGTVRAIRGNPWVSTYPMVGERPQRNPGDPQIVMADPMRDFTFPNRFQGDFA
jgi:hypothetical protein